MTYGYIWYGSRDRTGYDSKKNLLVWQQQIN